MIIIVFVLPRSAAGLLLVMLDNLSSDDLHPWMELKKHTVQLMTNSNNEICAKHCRAECSSTFQTSVSVECLWTFIIPRFFRHAQMWTTHLLFYYTKRIQQARWCRMPTCKLWQRPSECGNFHKNGLLHSCFQTLSWGICASVWCWNLCTKFWLIKFTFEMF